MNIVIYFLINILIVGLFLFSKLGPYKSRLTGRYINIFSFLEKIFVPFLDLLKKHIKPLQVGNGIAVDMSHIIMLLFLLILLNVIL